MQHLVDWKFLTPLRQAHNDQIRLQISCNTDKIANGSQHFPARQIARIRLVIDKT